MSDANFLKIYKDGDSLMVVLKNTPENQQMLIELLEQYTTAAIKVEDVGFADEKPAEIKPRIPLTAEEFKRLRKFQKEGGQLSEDEQTACDEFILKIRQAETTEEKIRIVTELGGQNLVAKGKQYIEENLSRIWGKLVDKL